MGGKNQLMFSHGEAFLKLNFNRETFLNKLCRNKNSLNSYVQNYCGFCRTAGNKNLSNNNNYYCYYYYYSVSSSPIRLGCIFLMSWQDATVGSVTKVLAIGSVLEAAGPARFTFIGPGCISSPTLCPDAAAAVRVIEPGHVAL